MLFPRPAFQKNCFGRFSNLVLLQTKFFVFVFSTRVLPFQKKSSLHILTYISSSLSSFRPTGISRDKEHKRRATGGKRKQWHKKRKYAMGRPAANTRLGPKIVHTVRTRGGNTKFRGLRLEAGNYSWGSENATRKTRILDVVYNASNNELVRTKTLVKNAIVMVDCTPFKQFYQTRYNFQLGKKIEASEETSRSNAVLKKVQKRKGDMFLDPLFADQFKSGRLLACIASRPGQCGRADGYLLEGKELEFYKKKLEKKKK
eukprot:TRINITY_DN1269_c0_g1_i1.p1 TRINITY_DN1269_c0_g1~~TRINITY_DN1269_c0_g1_i1.p1  ORF type:complete len:259 (+),score=44.05 TRINITY_DN1269_c0_g1_i1:362-1138(+)